MDKRRLRDDFVQKVYCPSLTGVRSEMGTPNTAIEGKQSPMPTLNDNVNETLNYQQDFGLGPDSIQIQLSGHAFEQSRSQLKSVISQKAEDTYVYRSLPLGLDRRRNRYWQFVTAASANEPGSSRIFVELRDGSWRLIDEEQVI